MSKPTKISVPGGGLLAITEPDISGTGGVPIPFVQVDASNLGVFGGLTRLPGDNTGPVGSSFIFNNFATNIGFGSSDDNGGVEFEVEGYDIGGNLIYETVTGPDDETVYTAQQFSIIKSITPDNDYTHLTITNGYFWTSSLLRTDYDREYWNATLQVTTTPSSGTMPWEVYGTAWPIPVGVWTPGSLPGWRIIDGSGAPIDPTNIVQAFQQQAFPLTAVWMRVSSLGEGVQTDLYTLEVLQQGVKA